MNQNTEAAANALFQAQRTGDSHAIDRADAYHRFQAQRATAAAATQREASRLQAIGFTGRYDESVAGHYGPHL
jgi:hypothetical protein